MLSIRTVLVAGDFQNFFEPKFDKIELELNQKYIETRVLILANLVIAVVGKNTVTQGIERLDACLWCEDIDRPYIAPC